MGDQDIGSPGKPISCGLQVSGELEHCRARTRALPAALTNFLQNVCSMDRVNDYDASLRAKIGWNTFSMCDRTALTGESTVPVSKMASCYEKDGGRIERTVLGSVYVRSVCVYPSCALQGRRYVSYHGIILGCYSWFCVEAARRKRDNVTDNSKVSLPRFKHVIFRMQVATVTG